MFVFTDTSPTMNYHYWHPLSLPDSLPITSPPEPASPAATSSSAMPRGRHDPATEAISGEVRGFPTENLCSGDLGVFFCGAKPHHNSATASAELTVKSIAPCIDRTTAFGQTPITSQWPTSGALQSSC